MPETQLPAGPFRAFRLREDGSGGEVTQVTLDELAAGDVVIRAEYSSVNYKDALAGTGTAPIARSLPLVGGIDVAGRVAASESADFAPGDPVLVTGCGLSETRDGGFAEYVRAPAESVIALPAGVDTRWAMALGTAGFTAGLALSRLEHNGLTPDAGPVVVTGATGGVGSVAIDILARRGYEVVAVSGKSDAADYLQQLGASRVVGRASITTRGRPLEKAVWAGAIDNVGGATLAELLRTVEPWGGVAAVGLAGGQELDTTVMPFIIRGVSLIGITSANCPRSTREHVWDQLAGPWSPAKLDRIVSGEIELEQLRGIFERLLAGATRGRTIVRLAGTG